MELFQYFTVIECFAISREYLPVWCPILHIIYFSESVLWICYSHVLRLPSLFPFITRISALFIGDVDELLASLDCGDRLLLLHTEHAHIHETSVQSQTIWNQRSCFGIHVYFHTSFLHQEHGWIGPKQDWRSSEIPISTIQVKVDKS